MTRSADILDFWERAGPKAWWRKDEAFDSAIRENFGSLHEQAARGACDRWEEEPDSCLALIIVLDQFSRNLFRNSPRAFENDPKALGLAKSAVARNFDGKMRAGLQMFCYLPHMHSEALEDQRACLTLMQRLGLEDNIKAAQEHLDIIERFGRFPHRNQVLGRVSTPEEIAFLEAGGFKG